MAKKKIKNKEFLGKASGGVNLNRQLQNNLRQLRNQPDDIKRVRPRTV